MNETMSEAQLLWLVADMAEQCAAHDIGLAVLLRRLAAVSSGNGKDHPGKIVMVAESAERSAASLLAFITSIRMRAVALEAQSRQQQTKINATAQRIANNEMLAGTVETAGVQAADLGGDGRDVDRPGRGNARDPTGRRPFSAATTASARSGCPGTTASLTRSRPSRRQPSPDGPVVTVPCIPQPAFFAAMPTAASAMPVYLAKTQGVRLNDVNDVAKVVEGMFQSDYLLPAQRAAL